MSSRNDGLPTPASLVSSPDEDHPTRPRRLRDDKGQNAVIVRSSGDLEAPAESKSLKQKDARDIAADREAFLKAVAAAIPRQSLWHNWLRSASAERLRFQADFLRLFFPTDNARFPGFEFILRSAPTSPVLQYSLDTLCLVHIGTANRDPRLQQAARRSYGMALSKMRKELMVPSHDSSKLMGAMHLMAICEFFSRIAASDGEGVMRHVRGMIQMLSSCKPETLHPEVRILLGTQLRGLAVWDCILRRKAMTGLGPLEHAMDMGTTFGATTELAKVAIQVPAALEACDILRSRADNTSPNEVMTCLERLTALKDDLRVCLEAWHSDTNEKPYRVAPVSELKKPRMIGAEIDRLFPHAFVFPTSLVAPKHRSYWVLLLALTQAQLELSEAFPSLKGEVELEDLERTAQETADNLCMTVAFDTQPDSGYVAMFSAMHPVKMASLWYRKKNDLRKLEWCRRALRSFQAAGLHPPVI